MTVKIPESLKIGEDLVVETNGTFERFFVAVYESPRHVYLADDTKQENPVWAGDVYAISDQGDRTTSKSKGSTITIPMIRGPDGNPALYGRYLVKVWVDDEITEKIIEVKS